MTPSKAELYNALENRHGVEIQKKFEAACIGIAGLGGLGSNIAVHLARMGVEHLVLADFDVVDITNLNRQHYTIQHLGTPKTEALISQLLDINPYLKSLALRRANTDGIANILDYIPKDVTLLPNTSGARNADEAVRIARLARECGCGEFIKIEVIRDSKYLLPDNYETIRATRILAKEGFVVMPYIYPDLNTARELQNAGAASIMPLGAPIGSNKGLCTIDFIKILLDKLIYLSL